MAQSIKFLGSALGLTAALSMAATPAVAAELPRPSGHVPFEMHGVFMAEDETADNFRHRRYRRNRVDAGDVIAGVLVIGAIAAIASSASSSKRDRRTRDDRYDNRDVQQRSQPRRGDARFNGESGIDGAVSQCVSAIERDVRVDSVDTVNRSADGWRVTGSIYNGEGFACQINARGEIQDISYGGQFSAQSSAAPVQDRQWSEDRYAAAWDRVEQGETAQQTRSANASEVQQASTDYGEPRYTPQQAQQQPAYPGGPLEGETLEERADEQVRTRVAQAGQ